MNLVLCCLLYSVLLGAPFCLGEVVTVGNQISAGSSLRVRGAFILTKFDLPQGYITSFHFHASQVSQNVLLQIWRPLAGNGDYKLIAQEEMTTNSTGPVKIVVDLPSTIVTEPGDKIGFTQVTYEGAISYQQAKDSTLYIPIEDQGLNVGKSYNFGQKLTLYKFSFAVTVSHTTIIPIGNPASDSRSVLNDDVQDLGFILSDFSLINGTLREFWVSTSGHISPLHLQIWRPVGRDNFLLISDTLVIPQPWTTYAISPEKTVYVQEGDQIGFLHETGQMSITYDFRPDGPGTRIYIRNFHPGSPLPTVSTVHQFYLYDFAIWSFTLSVRVDIAYGVDPVLPTTVTLASTQEGGNPWISTTPMVTIDPDSAKTIGNDIDPGQKLTNSSGTFILADYDLENGRLLNFRFYATVPRKTVVLQIWRPVEENEFTLITEKIFTTTHEGPQVVPVPKQIQIQQGDRIGFTHLDDTGIIAYQAVTGNPPVPGASTLFRKLVNNIRPVVDQKYFFDRGYHIYKFAIAVDVAVDEGQPPSSDPVTYRRDTDAILLAVLIGLLLALIAFLSTMYAIWRVSRRRGKFDVMGYENAVVNLTDKEWTIPHDNISLHETLSENHSGIVVKADVFGLDGKSAWKTCAVKMLKETASDHEKNALLQELQVMKTVRAHPNVLQLLGYSVSRDPLLMVVEFCPLGNLVDYLREVRARNLHLNIAGHSNFTLTRELISFGSQVARGMDHLAAQRILHRDLAARNVLIGEGRLCKITHFGFARDVLEYHQYQKTCQLPQPIRWMAPESLSSGTYTSKSDVWSFGILLWEIVTLGATPYLGMTTPKVIKSVKKGYRLVQPPHCKEELYSVMAQCWKSKAHDRPTFDILANMLQSLYDQNTDYIQLEKYPENQYTYLPKDEFDEIV